jgi:hypothetical protein
MCRVGLHPIWVPFKHAPRAPHPRPREHQGMRVMWATVVGVVMVAGGATGWVALGGFVGAGVGEGHRAVVALVGGHGQ